MLCCAISGPLTVGVTGQDLATSKFRQDTEKSAMLKSSMMISCNQAKGIATRMVASAVATPRFLSDKSKEVGTASSWAWSPQRDTATCHSEILHFVPRTKMQDSSNFMSRLATVQRARPAVFTAFSGAGQTRSTAQKAARVTTYPVLRRRNPDQDRRLLAAY
jgi:hypothetical protein